MSKRKLHKLTVCISLIKMKFSPVLYVKKMTLSERSEREYKNGEQLAARF